MGGAGINCWQFTAAAHFFLAKNIEVNRIDRLHAILTHLQSKKKVTAQEVADRFSISLRTVYRDVKALEESGVPVIGEAGSGYSIMEGYRLPPVMFTQEEASALLFAGKIAEKMTDTSVKKHFDAALYKVKAVLRGDDKEHMEDLSNYIAVFKSRVPEEEPGGKYLVSLQKAIVDKKVINMHYFSNYNEASTQRNAEPIGLCYYGDNWHLIAYCLLRNDYRDFRLNRIQKLQVLDESFAGKQHRSLQQYIDSMVRQSELVEVIVEFDKETVRHIGNQKYYYGYVREERLDNCVRMYFLTAFLEPFGRWLLMFTNSVIVQSPPLLKEIMQGLKEEIDAHYR